MAGLLAAHVVIYNSNLVSAANAPKSYNDLLDTRWKNQLAIPDSGVTWYHGMLQYMGAEKGRAYMKRLAAQNVDVQAGNRMMVELTMAGSTPSASPPTPTGSANSCAKARPSAG